jgi:2-(1,2-epoxy-1,2-dihydrophenyl)acetyl-CoA isomerase
MTAPVRCERRGAIALVTLDRPDRRNGVTVAMCEALHETVREIAASDARVLVLRGAGENFCVGADIAPPAEEAARPAPPDVAIYHASTLLHTMPQVTIAAIDGGCAGAGMGWALACDLRFGTPRARFSTAFLAVGVSGDMGLAWSLERIVGGARARELLFFPDRFGGEEAHRLGLLTRLFPPEALHSETLALAEALADRDPLALRLTKANCVSAETLSIGAYVDVETARHLQTTERPEFARLMRESHERRRKDPPRGSR